MPLLVNNLEGEGERKTFQSPILQFHYRLSEWHQEEETFEGSFAVSTDQFTFSFVVCGAKESHRILLLNAYGHYLYAWPIEIGKSRVEIMNLVRMKQNKK